MQPLSNLEAQALFFDYLRFATVSAKQEHRPDLNACVDWLSNLVNQWGLNSQIHTTAGAPILWAETPFKKDKPTLLIYGHYDVQPIEPLDLWTHSPFEPTVRNEFVLGRGATDNKGQTFSLLLGIQRMLARGTLPINIHLLIEGEEEIGSPHLAEWLKNKTFHRPPNAALICDTSMIKTGCPAITTGLRGIACFDWIVYGPNADLHSGMFGGPTPNPALSLSKILSRLHDAEGRITIPHFYDSVLEPTPAEKESWASLPWDETWFQTTTGLLPHAGEKGFSMLEKLWSRPTAEINGLTSGYQGSGSKTIIPAQASAKLSFRLVPGQTASIAAEQIKRWFENELAQEGMKGEVRYDHGGEPFYSSPDDPYTQAALESLDKVFGCAPSLTREGLSIPVAQILQSQLKIPVLLVGLGLPDCQAHSPNESFPLAHLECGANFLKQFVLNLNAMNT